VQPREILVRDAGRAQPFATLGLGLARSDGAHVTAAAAQRFDDRRLVGRARRLKNFLTQPFFVTEVFTGQAGKRVPLESTIAGVEDILAGRKVSSLWELKDWVFGGNYYWGRHGVFLYNNEITNPTVQRLLADYKTETFVHYADSNSSILFNSIQVIKNKFYDSPAVSVWDLKGGRE